MSSNREIPWLSYDGILNGNWDSPRVFSIEKRIPFLVRYRPRGEECWLNWDCCRGIFLVRLFWVMGRKREIKANLKKSPLWIYRFSSKGGPIIEILSVTSSLKARKNVLSFYIVGGIFSQKDK